MTYDSSKAKFFGAGLTEIELPRLRTQAEQVYYILANQYFQQWITVEQLQRALEARFDKTWPQPSLSARLRAMRNEGYDVPSKRAEGGVAQYRLMNRESDMTSHIKRSDRPKLIKLIKELSAYIDETGNNNLFLANKLEKAGVLETYRGIYGF